MALFDMSRPAVANNTVGARFSIFFSSIVGTIAAWNDSRVTRNALSRLSDHELDDLGLTRSDIDRM